MFETLPEWPLLLSGMFIIGLTAALGALLVAGAHWIARRVHVDRWLKGLLPNVGAAMTAGCIVWLGLLANTELRDIDEATQVVNAEAAALRGLDVTREATRSEANAALGQALRHYATVVAAEEWSRMSSSGGAPAATAAVIALRRLVLQGFGTEPPMVQQALLLGLRDIEHARATRLTVAEGRMPGVVWLAALTAAFIVLLFAAMAHAGHARGGAGYIMNVLLALLLGFNLFTLAVIDRPFLGRIAVSSQPLTDALPPLPPR